MADVPFALEWHVPTEKVVTDWRVLVPVDVMESVFWEAARLGAILGSTRAGEQTLLRRLACGRSPRAAPQEPRPSHRRPGILHRHMASHDPVNDVLPGHRFIIAGSDRRRSPRRRPRRPAHPQGPRTSAALQARAEGTPEIPARHRDEGNRHQETAGHRVHLWVLITTAATRTRQEGGTAPPARAADLADARSLPEQLKHH
jgi:hypothetical protein